MSHNFIFEVESNNGGNTLPKLKPLSLNADERKALAAAQKVLNKKGVELPKFVQESITTPKVETKPFTLSKKDLTRFQKLLGQNKQIVVTIAGPKGKFTIYTVDSFLKRQKHARKIGKLQKRA